METKRVAKRNHGAESKANILAACGQPGACVAAIAVRNGLNANVIYRWLSQSRQGSGPVQSVPVGALDQQISSFIAVQLPESAAPQTVAVTVTVANVTTAIRMELRRGTSSVAVVWPSKLASDCASGCDDPNRRTVAGNNPYRHAHGNGGFVGTGGAGVRFSPGPSRLPFCQRTELGLSFNF